MKGLILLSLAAMVIGLPLVYEIGLFMEWEYPHWPMLHHVRNARTARGEPIALAEAEGLHGHAEAVRVRTAGQQGGGVAGPLSP